MAIQFGFREAATGSLHALQYLFIEFTIVAICMLGLLSLLCTLSIYVYTQERTLAYLYTSYVRMQFSTSVEKELLIDLIFFLIPTSIILYLLFPTLAYLYTMEYNLFDNCVSYQVDTMAQQWNWSYTIHSTTQYVEYMYIPVAFSAQSPVTTILYEYQSYLLPTLASSRLLLVDNMLLLPAHIESILTVGSFDVIHSFFIPQFGIKMDAVPGYEQQYIARIEDIGVFLGACAEFCGQGHAYMPIVVNVMPEKNLRHILLRLLLLIQKKNWLHEIHFLPLEVLTSISSIITTAISTLLFVASVHFFLHFIAPHIPGVLTQLYKTVLPVFSPVLYFGHRVYQSWYALYDWACWAMDEQRVWATYERVVKVIVERAWAFISYGQISPIIEKSRIADLIILPQRERWAGIIGVLTDRHVRYPRRTAFWALHAIFMFYQAEMIEHPGWVTQQAIRLHFNRMRYVLLRQHRALPPFRQWNTLTEHMFFRAVIESYHEMVHTVFWDTTRTHNSLFCATWTLARFLCVNFARSLRMQMPTDDPE